MKLSVVGLGKLGICSAACFASRGFEVVGVDIDPRIIKAVNMGKAPFPEPRLQETMDLSAGRLRATRDYAEAIRNSEISFLIVPTPSRKDGSFSDQHLRDALQGLALAFRQKRGFHLFVITSTVSPGTVESSLIPLIEKVAGKRLNQDFGVCYNPEFIALGNVVEDFFNPDLVLIGESSRSGGKELERVYQKVCQNRPYVATMSIASAEIAKLSLNCYVTMKISFANLLANLCEVVPGAAVDDITRALGADKRISPYYLKGGLSFGGTCFPRDVRAFRALMKKMGMKSRIMKSVEEINHWQDQHLFRLVDKHISRIKNGRVGVLGLAFKSNTPVITESPAIKLISRLLTKKRKIIAYDPLARDNTRSIFGDRIEYAASARACLRRSSVVVISYPDRKFKAAVEEYTPRHPQVVLDCWRIVEPGKLSRLTQYVTWGYGPGPGRNK